MIPPFVLHQRPYTTCCKYSGCTGLTTVISNILNPAEKGCPLSEEICSQATLIESPSAHPNLRDDPANGLLPDALQGV